MKQVMCINQTNKWWNGKDQITVGPVYGEVCAVVNEVYEDGMRGYQLLEYPDREPFIASLFMPISNSSVEIAEEVMENESVEA